MQASLPAPYQPVHPQQQVPQPPHHQVRDMFCPDHVYDYAAGQAALSLPQLDGHEELEVIQCRSCKKVCETLDDFKWHKESKYGQEDCRILKSMLTFPNNHRPIF